MPPCDSHVTVIYRLNCKINIVVVLRQVNKWHHNEIIWRRDLSQNIADCDFTLGSPDVDSLKVTMLLHWDVIGDLLQ